MKSKTKILSIVVCLLLLTGCQKTLQREIPVRENLETEVAFLLTQNEARAAQVIDDIEPDATSLDQLSVAVEDVLDTDWPSSLLPEGLPKYEQGKVVNSGGDERDRIVLIDETTPEALEAYVSQLTGMGWSVTRGDAEEGLELLSGRYRISFQWNSTAMIQMDVYTSELATWPDNIPPEIVPPSIGTLLGNISVQGLDEGMGYFNFTCDGMNEAAAKAYMQSYLDKGWTGDTSFVSKDIEWQGKTYGASLEIYDIIDTQTTFTCNFPIQEE